MSRSGHMVMVRIVALGMALALAPRWAVALTLGAPDRVARGDAFVAVAESAEPVEAIVFHWLGKAHAARAEAVEAAKGGAPMWRAEILLPVPLDAVEGGRDVRAAARGRASGREARRRVAFVDRKRPVQRLSVDRKYVTPPAAVQARIKADREKVRAALARWLPGRAWTLPLARPVPDRGVSSLFGLKRVFNGRPRGLHRGLDLRAPQGEPALACADGVVALTGDLYFSGNVVYVNHGEGVFTAYLHLSRILVREGQRVRRGEPVGLVGATGRVTGPHLHLSLLAQGQSVDPQPFLEARFTGK